MEAVTTKKWSWDNFVKRKKNYILFQSLNKEFHQIIGTFAGVHEIYFGKFYGLIAFFTQFHI